MEFRVAAVHRELEEAYAVLKILRPHITQERFFELYDAASSQDQYTLLGAYENGACVAVLGFRILHDYVHGRHLYLDDLVVVPELRGKGIGEKMLAWAEAKAVELKCEGLRLCTGVENEGGIRLYKRLGWEPRAYAFKKKCVAVPG